MTMCSPSMPRSTRAFRIDDRVLDALDKLATKANISANKYLENLLLSHSKQLGEIPMDAEPLGDPRGGKRANSGRPKKTESELPIEGDRKTDMTKTGNEE